jgi:drug/metabolite transporter (DMT)-like permease
VQYIVICFFAGLADGKARYKETLVTSLVPLLTYFLFMIIFRTKATMKQVVALSMGTFGLLFYSIKK